MIIRMTANANYENKVKKATNMWESVLRTKHLLVAKRRALGLSQQDVAEALNMSLKKVKRFESYDDDPKVRTFIAYALLVGEADNSQVLLRLEDDIS